MIVIGIWNAEGKRNRDMIPAAVPTDPVQGDQNGFCSS